MVSLRKRYTVWWRRSGIGLRLVLFVVFVVGAYLLISGQLPSNEGGQFSSSLAVFSLVNLNIAVLCILVFLVGRNLIKILFDRKKKVLGSRLRSRLVAAFVGLTAIPAVLLVIVASGLLSRAIDGWFSSPAQTSVEAAKEIGRIHFREIRDQTQRTAKNLTGDLQALSMKVTESEFKGFLEKRRVAEALYAIQLLDQKFVEQVKVQNAAAHIDHFSVPEPESQIREQVEKGDALVTVRETSSSKFVQAFAPLTLKGEKYTLVVTYRVRSEMSEALDTIRQSYQEYLQLQHFRNPLRSTYILTLYMLAGLVLFAAMWVGIFIAKQLTGPIQRLSEAMREVARGNYGLQVHHSGEDEIAFLTKNFNQMSSELKESVNQAERRRVYLETVLSTLAVGVIVIDSEESIVGVNSAALEIMGREDTPKELEGKRMRECVPESLVGTLNQLLVAQSEDETPELREKEVQIEVVVSGRKKKLLCTSGTLLTRTGDSLGSVLLLDDVTALSEAQKLAAWREAARRIAHEIKNPLTPIKLAAQRLKRTFRGSGSTDKIVSEASMTIVDHVDSIKRLADEFSRFARMPTAEFSSADLNALVNEIVSTYAEDETGMIFQSILDDTLPQVHIDQEQMRRLLINLIDNAVQALRSEQLSLFGSSDKPRIVVKSHYEDSRNLAILEVCDNGPGIAAEDRPRVFEPYFSRTAGGTGLGLAIVSAIVSEHRGEIVVAEHEPRGTKVIVSFPVVVREGTQRKFEFANRV